MGERAESTAGDIDSRLWLIPFAGVVGAFVAGVGLVLFLARPDGVGSTVGVPLGGLGGLVVQGCMLASGITYYREVSQLEAADADWVPTWWAYLVGTLLLGPLVMALYVVRRVGRTDAALDPR